MTIQMLLLLTFLLHISSVISTKDEQSSIRKHRWFLQSMVTSTKRIYYSFRNLSAPDPLDDIQEITGPIVIETVARFDSTCEGAWQRIFDFGNGPCMDNVWLGQSASTSDMRFSIFRDGTEHCVTASNAIINGEIAQWRAGVDSSGRMWIEKNDVRLIEGMGAIPSNVIRTSKLIGRSNWVADSPLNGAVLGISITNENSSIDLDLLNTAPRIRGPFKIRFLAQFDDLSGAKHWQRVFDFGNGPLMDNVLAGQLAGTKDFYFEVIRDGVSQRVIAPNAIEASVMTVWRVGVDTNGWMWIEKNGELVANGQGHVPCDVRRTNNYIGAFNWEADRKLQGVVLGLRLDSS